MKNKLFAEIEFLRGIAIIGVLLIHTTAYFTLSNTKNWASFGAATLDILSHYAVPLFIFISGYLLAFKIKQEDFKISAGFTRIKNILPSFILTSLLYLLMSYWFYKDQPQFQSVPELVFKLVTAQGGYHLWYFMLLFQFYLIFPFLYKLNQKITSKNNNMIFVWLAVQIV